ncbi:hypothetical protein ACIQWR_12085 [Streptomyces sp. NPDC098789]|uniref:hypothetical protein n=1 Tax=Streptomyces sp. NPDC098789 TaxID=3366098 RepID=UPI0037FA70E7
MTTSTYSPLHEPERDGARWVPPLDFALEIARDALAKQGEANIYDDRAVLTAAVVLDHALRGLVAALDAETGR